jgi:hypothetical protein
MKRILTTDFTDFLYEVQAFPGRIEESDLMFVSLARLLRVFP